MVDLVSMTALICARLIVAVPNLPGKILVLVLIWYGEEVFSSRYCVESNNFTDELSVAVFYFPSFF